LRSQHELSFIDQFSRKIMVELADVSVRFPDSPLPIGEVHPVYLGFIEEKGWITKREPKKLSAKGWQIATSFLSR
jgi:hypothetical protein